MRVLVVGNYPADGQHSMQRYGRTLVAGLRESGVEADLIAPAVLAGQVGRWMPRLAKTAGYVDKYLLFPWRLWRRAARYDLIHIADHSNAPYQAWCRGRPLVLTCHDLFAVRAALEPGAGPGWRVRWSGRVLQRWILRSLRQCRTITCVSHATAQEVRRLVGGDRHIDYIPNAVAPFFRVLPADDAETTVRALGIDAPYFLHVGGNQVYKNRPGVVRLFEALATRPAYRDVRLVLAGKAPDAPLAQAIQCSPVRDRIEVVVGPTDVQIRALYNRARALLFISLDEGFGWPVLEAQACGCPVVTSDAEPMRSVLGGGGVLVDPRDPATAAQRIEAAEARWEGYLAQAARNLEGYQPDALTQRYVDLYRRVLQP